MTVLNSFCQNIHPTKYKDIVFDKVDIQKNLLYSTADSIRESYRQFDLYQPANDSSSQKRPLIIWLHGGGFKYGTKMSMRLKFGAMSLQSVVMLWQH